MDGRKGKGGTDERGTRKRSTAFSWTCHPNRKLVNPERVSAQRNVGYVGDRQSLNENS